MYQKTTDGNAAMHELMVCFLASYTYIHKLCRDADKRCVWEDSTVQVRTERSKVRATQ